MMNPLSRIGLILFLVVFQTTIYYAVPILDHFADLLIIFVIYAGTFLPFWEGLGLGLLLGVLMDSIAGGLFGLHVSVYFWVIVVLQPFVTLLNLKNPNSLRLLLAVGIVFENLMLFLGTFALKHQIVFSPGAFREMMFQLAWTLILGPFFIRFLHRLDRRPAEVPTN